MFFAMEKSTCVGYFGLTQAAKNIVEGQFMEKHGDKVDLLPETEQLIIKLPMLEEISTAKENSEGDSHHLRLQARN